MTLYSRVAVIESAGACLPSSSDDPLLSQWRGTRRYHWMTRRLRTWRRLASTAWSSPATTLSIVSRRPSRARRQRRRHRTVRQWVGTRVWARGARARRAGCSAAGSRRRRAPRSRAVDAAGASPFRCWLDCGRRGMGCRAPCPTVRVSLTASLSVSLTVSPTVSHCVSLTVPLTASPSPCLTVSPSITASLCVPLTVSHCVSHCVSLTVSLTVVSLCVPLYPRP